MGTHQGPWILAWGRGYTSRPLDPPLGPWVHIKALGSSLGAVGTHQGHWILPWGRGYTSRPLDPPLGPWVHIKALGSCLGAVGTHQGLWILPWGRGQICPMATQGHRDAAENVGEQGRQHGRRQKGGGGSGVDPALRLAPPWSWRRRHRPQAPAGGRRPALPLMRGRKRHPPPPPRPTALVPHLPSPLGQPGGQAPGASWVWGRVAPTPRRGGCPAFWVGLCTGVSLMEH